MVPRKTFQLARISGIRIGVGASWFLMLFLFIILVTAYFHRVLGGSQVTAYLVSVAIVLSFFVSLVLHELGHALVARRNGLAVLGIELWALGGMTRTTGAPEGPGAQFRVAAAGPAVTLAVIVVSLAAGTALASEHHFLDVAVASGGVHSTPVVVWLSWVATLNVLVLGLNLIPAFPLDGGQIAQAVLWWMTGDRNRATRITGRVGQGFALLLGVASMYLLTHGELAAIWLIMIAMFIYQAAGAAVMQGAVGQRIQRLTVADVMDREPAVIPGELKLLDAQEQFFARYRRPWFAVVDQTRHFLGVVRAERLDSEIGQVDRRSR